jgi:hypothetical protein
MEVKGPEGEKLEISLGLERAPTEEDLLLNVTVAVKGYSAADQSWVVSKDWRSFLAELNERCRSIQQSCAECSRKP